MGLLSSVLGLRKTSETRHPGERRIPYTAHTQAGVYITPDRALMNDTVWAAHRYLTQTTAQLPARVMRNTPDGSKQVISHPVDNVLNWRTNPELSPFQFRETMVGWAIMHGNAVAEIERDYVGRVVNLWPVRPDRVTILRDVETGELVYRINNGNQGSCELKPMDVFHLRGYGDDAVGLSVIEYAAQSIGWARATELFGASFFGEGMHFGGAAIFPGASDADAVRRLRAELENAYKGPSRSGKWFIGDGNIKLEKMTATPEEAQYVNVMQHQVEVICRYMGVPPQKVYHLLRATFSNIEQLSIDVIGDSIVPWASRLEQEATYKLFGKNRTGFYVTFEVKGLLRGDFATRQSGLQIMRRNGIINADDWAELEDMKKPGLENGGQTYVIEGAMVPLEQIGQMPTPGIPALPEIPAFPEFPGGSLGTPSEVTSTLGEVDRLLGLELIDAE